jgi:hypothetical protein
MAQRGRYRAECGPGCDIPLSACGKCAVVGGWPVIDAALKQLLLVIPAEAEMALV